MLEEHFIPKERHSPGACQLSVLDTMSCSRQQQKDIWKDLEMQLAALCALCTG